MATEDTNRPTAKRLILSLLSAPSLPEVSIAMLQRWGELFDIDGASMRVTVGRLTRQGLLSSQRRGVYRMGPAGRTLAAAASGWRDAEARTCEWRGDWLFAHVAHLGRVNRGALRARERAFRLSGFAELAGGLWCRPANLREPPTATRERLTSLGLESDAILTCVSDIPGVRDRDLFKLWPRRQIERQYHRQLRKMLSSRKRLVQLSLESSAKETLLVGEAVIRQINADPLLPDAMLDTHSRREMIEAMVDYDRLGQDIWRRFAEACAARNLPGSH
jgi:phenylacetic acid degradation operon negative regulatory protein